MQMISLRVFQQKLKLYRQAFRLFTRRTERNPPKGIDKLTPLVARHVWEEVDCLTCANCCKVMTPTFTEVDIIRIAAHFNETPEIFKKKWLKKQSKDWVNKQQPCQFLNLDNNMCSIYAIRPDDCAGFPHLTKKPWSDYAHVHRQNIDYCPATFKMIEKMTDQLGIGYK